jgi:hypothetical protein
MDARLKAVHGEAPAPPSLMVSLSNHEEHSAASEAHPSTGSG